ncbi:DUF1016 N-terminal domain-containing protein [Arthrobacter sp. EM1]|nr:DUF1016 N-terminal domain-containing protein [Arthrobacter sp. EM1]WGZ81375.1 DUF1016 N-terminal domain-containing protein [Arthrobacter sp. EM1]
MLLSYWSIGSELAKRESAQGWGSKVVTRLAADVRSAFPEATGSSPQNLRYMKSFAQAWPGFPMLQAPLATLPWYHQIALIEKPSDPEPGSGTQLPPSKTDGLGTCWPTTSRRSSTNAPA